MLIRSDAEWEALSDDERDMGAIMQWWGDLAGRGMILGGEQLQPARTATTVSWEDRKPIVTDGPFMETKETIAGYGILEVNDLDAALELVKTWPARGHRVEIRPVV
ncbi:MAG: YciI family protein [Candidatus Dormibacteria bacterium]